MPSFSNFQGWTHDDILKRFATCSPSPFVSPTPPSLTSEKLGKINRWIKSCNDEHGQHCQGSQNTCTYWPTWLIDANEDCIVPGAEAKRYIALSYVWGGAESLLATTENINHLKAPGNLRRGPRKPPKTILQAMQFTKLIGERYLWVDQLCILQGDEASKAHQISNMSRIYSHAYLTMVAAGARSAREGLGGASSIVQYSSEPHLSQQQHYSALRTCPWNERGWTFQELLFSQRAIFFFGGFFTWECHCVIKSSLENPSDLPSPECQERRSKGIQGFQYCSWPDLEEYSRIVLQYNRRALTYSSDALLAFSGITTALATVFEGGFLYGLPELFFDAALLWLPTKASGCKMRLEHNGILPSWSWAAWEGEVDLVLWAGSYGYLKKRPIGFRLVNHWPRTSINIHNTVQWYCRLEGGGQVPINASALKYHYLKDSSVAELPAGWAAHHSPFPSWLRKGLGSSMSFTHSSDKNTTFNYPIPIIEASVNVVPSTKLPLINCKTQRTWVLLDKSQQQEYGVHPHACFPLLDTEKKWAGILVCDPVGADQIPDLCELVSISEGFAENRRDESWCLCEWKHPKRPRKGELYRYHNVLWIKWKHGIAYRRAVGRVLKLAWENAGREPIDVVLG